MPIIHSSYKAPYYLFNGHVQTIIPNLFRSVKGLTFSRERITTPDDDFLDLDWSRVGSEKLVIISHGLEGSTNRQYVKGMVNAFNRVGWDAMGWNCRSCSGEMNWLARFLSPRRYPGFRNCHCSRTYKKALCFHCVDWL
jgi:hypothetical protein